VNWLTVKFRADAAMFATDQVSEYGSASVSCQAPDAVQTPLEFVVLPVGPFAVTTPFVVSYISTG